MNIRNATDLYEMWLNKHTVIIEEDIALKHQLMASGLFPFLRATFYRWAQLWPTICPELTASPVVLCVGDLHIENFGTWRDREGRLVWGVNDFDEAYYLPYPNDLVRVATSVLVAREERRLRISTEEACATILRGYRESLESRGKPIILEEEQPHLREIAQANLRDPVRFWQKMKALPDIEPDSVPETVRTILTTTLPEGVRTYRIKRRVSGLGSLGYQRYVAVADWNGGKVARQAKALVPSSVNWAQGSSTPAKIHYPAITGRAVRCADPCLFLYENWVVRRLAPSCVRIEISELAGQGSEEKLLYAMGWETANIHLGSATQTEPEVILQDLERLRRQEKFWLVSAAQSMASAVLADWQVWKGE